MTRLLQIMLEELERRNYTPSTTRRYIRTLSISLAPSAVHPTGSEPNTSGSTRLRCSARGSWRRTP